MLRGSRDALNHVDPDEVVASIDLSGLGSGEYMLTARARVDNSQDVGVVRIEPPTVKVRISSGKR
jgi:hypothetical protein